MRLRCFWFFVLTILCVSTLRAELRQNEQKIYICEDSLCVSDRGLYLYDLIEGYLPISAVFFDEDGLYIIDSIEMRQRGPEYIDNRCLNGHERWCKRCGGCAVAWCLVGRCKCVEWPFIAP